MKPSGSCVESATQVSEMLNFQSCGDRPDSSQLSGAMKTLNAQADSYDLVAIK